MLLKNIKVVKILHHLLLQLLTRLSYSENYIYIYIANIYILVNAWLYLLF